VRRHHKQVQWGWRFWRDMAGRGCGPQRTWSCLLGVLGPGLSEAMPWTSARCMAGKSSGWAACSRGRAVGVAATQPADSRLPDDGMHRLCSAVMTGGQCAQVWRMMKGATARGVSHPQASVSQAEQAAQLLPAVLEWRKLSPAHVVSLQHVADPSLGRMRSPPHPACLCAAGCVCGGSPAQPGRAHHQCVRLGAAGVWQHHLHGVRARGCMAA